MTLCQTYTDQQLLAKIQQYGEAIEKVALGGGVGRVQGEGRMVEFVPSNIGLAQATLRTLIAEAVGRGLMDGRGGAIAVEIG